MTESILAALSGSTQFWLGAAAGSLATLLLVVGYSVGICWWLTRCPE